MTDDTADENVKPATDCRCPHCLIDELLTIVEAACPDGCDGGWFDNSEEHAAWWDRYAQAGNEWRAAHPNEASIPADSEYGRLVDEEGPEARTWCPRCEGKGTVLTEQGRKLVDFFNRHTGSQS